MTKKHPARKAKKQVALAKLREVFDIPLQRVIKLQGTDSIFEFELEDGLRLACGTTSELLKSKNKLEVAFAEKLGKALPKRLGYTLKDEEGEIIDGKVSGWRTIVQDILDATETIPTSSEAEETAVWLYAFVGSSSLRGADQTYLTDRMPAIDFNDKKKLFATLQAIKANANESTGPSMKGFFANDERCYLHLPTLLQFVNFNSLRGAHDRAEVVCAANATRS